MCVAAEVITVVPVLRDPAVYYQADKIFFIFTVIYLLEKMRTISTRAGDSTEDK